MGRTDVAISTSSKTFVHSSAESGSAFFAVPATTVGDVEWHDYSVTFLEEGDSTPGLNHDAHILMTWVSVNFVLHIYNENHKSPNTYQSIGHLEQLFVPGTL